MGLKDNIVIPFWIILMLGVAWIIGSHLWNITDTNSNNIAQLMMKLSIVITLIIIIFLPIILQAIGKQTSLLNGILAVGSLFMGIILVNLLTGFIWDITEALLASTELTIPKLIMQILIIILTITFGTLMPIMIAIGETNVVKEAF